MSGVVLERAPAKLNVFLRVLGRRADGYHDIETLILPLDLCDVVTVEAAEAPTIEVVGERAGELSLAGGESLTGRAAEAFASAVGPEAGAVRITVEKRIPVAAGMGGGSADAAAVLRALGRLHGVGRDDLSEIAATVGSDVPALLHGGAVFATGRGERIVPVHAPTTTWLVQPFTFGIRSEDAYAWWDGDPTIGPDPGAVIAAFETSNLDLLGSALFDDLQPGVAGRHPEIDVAVDAALAAGAAGAVMTGSGPTVVALARHSVHAAALERSAPGSFVVSGPPHEAAYDDDRSGVV
ncbi:MAG: 4-(cytidine 5'-diphospho)-2-C-methyl-D-erythritol kinase [Actinomycetota bacterium]